MSSSSVGSESRSRASPSGLRSILPRRCASLLKWSRASSAGTRASREYDFLFLPSPALRLRTLGADEEVSPNACSNGSKAQPWIATLVSSVTLQRHQFQVLAGCAPTSADAEAGRLGHLLSEVPEFWRAAPEAAVEWGAAEFDLPLSPHPNEAEDELRSTGLLRASGVRL